MKIITKQLAERLSPSHQLLQLTTIDPQDIKTLTIFLSKIKIITIYDYTTTMNHPRGEIIGVKDHINRTGTNPLIGNQKKLNIDFIDIGKTYKRKKNYIVTNCCGAKINLKYEYPSHYLCNISILAMAMGIENISAYLVNAQ